MKAILANGPVSRPAHSYSRRPIGTGPRTRVETRPAHRATRLAAARKPGRPLTRTRTTLYATIVASALVSLTAIGIGAAVDAPRSLMSRADYAEAKKVIEADTRTALMKCRSLEGKAKDVCKAEANAADRVSKADLDARYRGTVDAESDARLARAKAQYEIAKAKCGDRIGGEKSACLTAARHEKARAIAEARPSTT